MFTLLFTPLLFIAGTLALTLEWPNYPEHGQNFSLQWTAGTPPYVVSVLEPNLRDHYYKYQGSKLFTFWVFSVPVGTQVYFQVIDSTGTNVTSPAITVISSPSITYPPNPPSGVNSTVSWTGGWSPYTVYVLSADLQRYYWKYDGADTIASWYCQLDPGTEVIFQVVDNQNIKDTGLVATVAPGPASTTQPSSLSTSSVTVVSSLSSLPVGSSASITTTVFTIPSDNSRTGTPTSPHSSSQTGIPIKKPNNTAAIAGGAVGGFLVLGVVAGIAYFVHKKHSSRSTYATADSTLQTPSAKMAAGDPFLIAGESHFVPPPTGQPPPPPRADYPGLPEAY